jgi:hypothetical protein
VSGPAHEEVTTIASVIRCQLKIVVATELRGAVRRLARRRKQSMSQLVGHLLEREVGLAEPSGDLPSESAIREFAILFAVEHVLKVQELMVPGGAVRSQAIIDAAAKSASDRLDMIEASLEWQR